MIQLNLFQKENRQTLKLQKPCRCGNEVGYYIPTPELIHEGKIVCSDCHRFQKWKGKNEVITNLPNNSQGVYA